MKAKFRIGDLVVTRCKDPQMKIVDDKLGVDKNKNETFNGFYLCAFWGMHFVARFILREEDLYPA